MNMKSLIVYVDRQSVSAAPLDATRALAERFDAHVIGVAAADRVAPLYMEEGGYAVELMERERKEIKTELTRIEHRFRTELATRASRLEWRSVVGFPAPFLAAQAHSADLIVIGHLRQSFSSTWNVNAGDILMAAGRPLLVIPEGAKWRDPDTIMLAWKQTRETRRAFADALPLLKIARHITLVSALEEDARDPVINQLNEVRRWLERHGVNAAVRCEDIKDSAAVDLLEISSEIRADMIVAGAYGHSRVREWALGGVTRHLLARAACPLFLSH
jgi:nucleotide-binding universal stress UspA family protein